MALLAELRRAPHGELERLMNRPEAAARQLTATSAAGPLCRSKSHLGWRL